MLMHGIEIQTAARYGIPAIFVVINNGALGNVWLRAVKEGPGAASPHRDSAARLGRICPVFGTKRRHRP